MHPLCVWAYLWLIYPYFPHHVWVSSVVPYPPAMLLIRRDILQQCSFRNFCSRCPMLLFTYVIIFVMLDEAGQKTSVPWVLLLMSVTQVACFLTVWQRNRQKTELLSELELTYHMVSTSPLSCMIVYCGKNHQKQPLFSSSSLQHKLFLCFLPQVPAYCVQRHCLS